MKQKIYLFLTCLVAMLCHATTLLADAITLPTASSDAISWNNSSGEKYNVENNGANVGSTHNGTVITFTLNNTVAQDYIVSFLTGTKNAATLEVSVFDADNTYGKQTCEVVNTNSWTPSVKHEVAVKGLPVGESTLQFKVTAATGNYAGNYGVLYISPADDYYEKVPGTLNLNKGSYTGDIRTENNGDNVGWVTNGSISQYTFNCTEAGVYTVNAEINDYSSDGTWAITITDAATGTVEATGEYHTGSNSGGYTATAIPLIGNVSTGVKKMTSVFTNGGGFILNYKALSLARTGDKMAFISGISAEGIDIVKGTDTDWYSQMPMVFGETTTIRVNSANATVVATAVNGTDAVNVTDNGDGTFSLPTPAPGSTTVITFTTQPLDGAADPGKTWTAKLYRIGEITMTDLYINGNAIDLPEGINQDNFQATISGMTFTTVPELEATFIDGSKLKAEGTVSEDNTSATYTFAAEVGGMSRTFTVTVEGISIYTPTANDKSVELRYSSTDKQGNNWSNGLYTLETTGLDGWNGTQFKFNGSVNTLKVPADVKVNQLKLVNFYSNYDPSGTTSVSIQSEGANVTLPTINGYKKGQSNQYTLVANIEGHTAGTPIVVTINGGGQPVAWFEIVYENVAPTTAPALISQTITDTENTNHAVVSLSFDRAMTEATATVGDKTVKALGGSSTLNFPIWDLDYNKAYTFTLPAGAAADEYGNKNAADITVAFSVGQQPAVVKKAYDYVVSDVAEFKAALAAANSSNSTETAQRKVIFIKNGDYDFGSEQQTVSGYNISLIGESVEGVLLHGNRGGITNPVLSLGNNTGTYAQDFTIRNDLNWAMADKGGVGVALSGGKKAVLKNVTMQSNQDTYVTGDKTYIEGGKIHGTVDFICGGGDIFFNQVNLVLEDRKSNVIVAPNTTANTKWGYVLSGCTVSAAEGASQVVDGSWNLGRPWQNEPRAYYVNTRFNVMPSDNGWTNMSNLITHFYEFGSVDAQGNLVDLSVRGNSPSSLNTYTPVLSADEAANFTMHNVLGSTDSWLPTELTEQAAKPVLSVSGNTITWSDDAKASSYVVFKDGEYLANVTEAKFIATEKATYTVRAANAAGGLGEAAEAVTVDNATGINTVTALAGQQGNTLYNLAGQRVGSAVKGIYIVGGRKVVVK